ncbi:uncharacterized protein LOC122365400 [Amphibalanus amphitrite]|uniref:uncharacterized protein LOC122365400 n=1 Tax=Amphibalanus amphitrite TaxID=1232801 RepID=UPI001C906813|nr:uncharacterized protein LOC122365400 [Amphibalanus amphitrite]
MTVGSRPIGARRSCLRCAHPEGAPGCGAPRTGHARIASVQRPRPGRDRAAMAAELQRRKEQLRQRLSRHLSTSQESLMNIPPASSLRNVLKTGQLLKLSSRGRLYPRCWKKRLCVLTNTTLYIYKTEGDSGPERPVGHIELSVFSQCKEMAQKQTKKTTHAFVLSRPEGTTNEVARHVFAADSAAELSDWLRKLHAAAGRGAPEATGRGAPLQLGAETASAVSGGDRGAGPSVDPASVPLPEGAGRRPRGRARQRPRPAIRPGPTPGQQGSLLVEPSGITSSSQPCLLDWPARGTSSGRPSGGGGLSSAYEYSSSGESDSSLASSRCSVVRRLNTTMPEIVLPRRSDSPLAAVATTSASDVRQQTATPADGFPPLSPASQPQPKRGSLPSIVASLQRPEKDVLSVGGTASTGSSSITNLTRTLTREGQTVPEVLSSLAELREGLSQAASRLDSVERTLAGSEAEMATSRADIVAVQGSLASLQSLATSLNNKMTLFSGMFRKVDEQLQEMWSEMETVNNNVHHVMHTALESQERNEQLFAQLSSLRSQLLASFPEQLTSGGSLPRPSRHSHRHGDSRRRRERLDSELLCEIDDPALDEVAPPVSAAIEKTAPPALDAKEKVAPPASVAMEKVAPQAPVSVEKAAPPSSVSLGTDMPVPFVSADEGASMSGFSETELSSDGVVLEGRRHTDESPPSY